MLLASAIETLVRSSNKVSKIYYIHVCKFILKYFVKIFFCRRNNIDETLFSICVGILSPSLVCGSKASWHKSYLTSLHACFVNPFLPIFSHIGLKKWTLLEFFWQTILLIDKFNLLYSSVFKLHGVNLDANNTVSRWTSFLGYHREVYSAQLFSPFTPLIWRSGANSQNYSFKKV